MCRTTISTCTCSLSRKIKTKCTRQGYPSCLREKALPTTTCQTPEGGCKACIAALRRELFLKNGTSLLAEGERLLKVARQVADRSNFANARDLTNARDLADGSERINGGDLSGFAALARPAKLAGLVGLADAREPDIGLLLNGFERKMKERMLKRSKRFLI